MNGTLTIGLLRYFLLATAVMMANSVCAERIDVLMTRGTDQLWEPLNPSDDYSSEDAEEELGRKLEELRSKHPDSLLIDLGSFATPGRGMETSYDSRHVSFFRNNDYSAVNVAATDYALGVAHSQGFRKRPRELEDFYISALNFRGRDFPPFPAQADVQAGNQTVRLASISQPSAIASLPTVIGDVVYAREDVTLSAAESDQSADLLIALSELDDERTRRLFGAYPGLNMVVRVNDTVADDVEERDGRYLVPAPNGHEVAHLHIDLEDDGSIESAGYVRHPWTTKEKYDSLVQPGLPVIGMSVPGEGRVAEILGIETENVLLDVHRDVDFPDLTSRRNIYTYNITMDEVPYRVYRVYHRPKVFWIPQDQLVILNRDNTIRRIVTNLESYPLTSWNTRLGEGLQRVLNKHPDEWNLPIETTAGIEEHAERILRNLRHTLEVNARLYPYDAEGTDT